MFEETPLVMVETADALHDVAKILSQAPVLGIDTESDSSHSYQERVCVLQVSDSHNDYIIDTVAIRDMSPLVPIFANREQVKVLHGADYDIVCLRRDFDLKIRGLFDTLVAAQLLGLERIGLADLIGQHFGIDIDKKFQRHDWGQRPLLPEHVEYARGDTHYLLALREIMIRKLGFVGRMRHLREECRILEKRKWHGRAPDPDDWLDAKRIREIESDDARRVLRRLWAYREREAKKMNRPVYKVIPEDVLIDLAKKRPTTDSGLDAIIGSRSGLRRRHGRALFEEVARGLEDRGPMPTRRKAKKVARPKTKLRTRLRGRQADRVLADLKQWRTETLEGNEGLNPYIVASNATLKWIATLRPMNLEELADVPEVRRWQVADYGVEILDRLDRITD